MKATPVRKTSLREQVYASLLRLLLQGRWAPGERWNDSALAAELGVSRTPIREAMIQLEAEGLLACDPNRGFYLPPLYREEAEDLYPILWSLEQLAVFLTPAPAAQLRERLERTVLPPSASGTASEMAAAVRQDRAWHLALVEASANSRLVRLHQRLEALSRRYASTSAPDAGFAQRTSREHAQILDALASDQPARAHALLKMHWRAEMETVVRALDRQNSKPSSTGSSGTSPLSRRTAAAGRRS